MRILLHSFHDDDDDDDDGDNYNDDNDDDLDMKTFAHQDYVDENLAAFQAQITQLQGEYLSPSSTGIFTRLFCGLFEPSCVSTSVFWRAFHEVYSRKISSWSGCHYPQSRSNESLECRDTPTKKNTPTKTLNYIFTASKSKGADIYQLCTPPKLCQTMRTNTLRGHILTRYGVSTYLQSFGICFDENINWCIHNLSNNN